MVEPSQIPHTSVVSDGAIQPSRTAHEAAVNVARVFSWAGVEPGMFGCAPPSSEMTPIGLRPDAPLLLPSQNESPIAVDTPLPVMPPIFMVPDISIEAYERWMAMVSESVLRSPPPCQPAMPPISSAVATMVPVA